MIKEILENRTENESKKDRWEAKLMKNKFLRNLLITSGVMLAMSNTAFAGQPGYDENDVTPPWGRIIIQDATEVNNVNYVEREQVTVQIYARDNVSNWVYYHLSTSPISTTTPITDWTLWNEGATETIDLPNVTGTNTIYAAFKDYNGNTSIIYDESLSHTIVYDVNGGTEGVSGVDATLTYGESHVVTMQRPKWEGHYFLGWSTEPDVTDASYEPGDVVAYNELAGLGDTITLYAIWTTSEYDLPYLSDVVEIGDYVNYPVVYDNVTNTTYKGWRVIGVEDDGTINLVSAGIPLTYCSSGQATLAVIALTTDFLTTTITTSGSGYRKTGVGPYLSLTEVFNNEYTKLNDNNVPMVRSITLDDIDNVIGYVPERGESLKDEKYENLIDLKTKYWIANVAANYAMFVVGSDGCFESALCAANSESHGVRPVVSLNAGIRATGQDMIGAWNITTVR